MVFSARKVMVKYHCMVWRHGDMFKIKRGIEVFKPIKQYNRSNSQPIIPPERLNQYSVNKKAGTKRWSLSLIHFHLCALYVYFVVIPLLKAVHWFVISQDSTIQDVWIYLL